MTPLYDRYPGPGGGEYKLRQVKRCDRCRRDTVHSTNGRCLELHRGGPLRRSKTLRYVKPQDERDRWKLTKARVFERDNWQCQRCGKAGTFATLDCHHRALKGHGGVSDDEREYGLAGLVCLDRICHDIVHGPGRDDFVEQGFVIPRFPGEDPATVPVLTIRGRVLLGADGSFTAVEDGAT